MDRAGPELGLLLLAGFRKMVGRATSELASAGHHDVRAIHFTAMRAIVDGADAAVALAQRLSVTKQAAAKTILALEERGYVDRRPDGADGRRKRLVVTPLGADMIEKGLAVFDRIRMEWEDLIGSEALTTLEGSLRTFVGAVDERGSAA